MAKKISVIMPVYNEEKFLAQSLDRYFEQTLAPECELICVDDGSTDTTLDILNSYSERYPGCITILKQANQGSGKARNAGIAAAQAEFIAFLDADDVYPEANTLALLHNSATDNNVQIAGGSLIMFNDTEEYSDYANTLGFEGHTFLESKIINYADFQFDYGYLRFIYARSLLQNNSIVFPDYLRYQDPPFFVRAMLAAQKFYAIQQPTYKYRVSAKTINWDTRRATDMIKGMTDVGVMAAQNNLERLFSYNLMRLNIDNNPVFSHLIIEQKNFAVLEALYAAKQILLNTPSQLDLEALLQDTPQVREGIAVALTKAAEHPQLVEDKRLLALELEQKTAECDGMSAYNKQLLASSTWKAGRAVTWLPRTIKAKTTSGTKPSNAHKD